MLPAQVLEHRRPCFPCNLRPWGPRPKAAIFLLARTSSAKPSTVRGWIVWRTRRPCWSFEGPRDFGFRVRQLRVQGLGLVFRARAGIQDWVVGWFEAQRCRVRFWDNPTPFTIQGLGFRAKDCGGSHKPFREIVHSALVPGSGLYALSCFRMSRAEYTAPQPQTLNPKSHQSASYPRSA